MKLVAKRALGLFVLLYMLAAAIVFIVRTTDCMSPALVILRRMPAIVLVMTAGWTREGLDPLVLLVESPHDVCLSKSDYFS